MKKRITILLAIFTILFCFAACGKSQPITNIGDDISSMGNKFYSYIENGDYQKAIEYYNEKIYGNYVTENEAREICNNYYENVITGFANGIIGEEEAEIEKNKVITVANGCSLPYKEEHDIAFEEIKTSKKQYVLGCAAFDAQNYETAIDYFSQIVEKDSNYADAQAKTAEAKTQLKTQYLAQAKEQYDADKIPAALQTLEKALGILGDDIEIQAQIDNYSVKFINDAIQSAEDVFINPAEDWEESIKLIMAAQQYMPDNAELQEAKDYYEQFRPVSLFSLKYYAEGKYGDLGTHRNEKDTFGNVYELVFIGACDSNQDQSNVYDIGKKYNVFSGTFAITNSSKGTDYVGYIKIYGDGELLWENTDIGSSTKPTDFSVDITGVTDLKIRMCGGGNMNIYGLYTLLANPTLQRTVE